MLLRRKVPFEDAGTKYEVGVFSSASGFLVRALKNGKPVNGYAYTVEWDEASDLKEQFGMEVVQHLVELAMDDVRTGRWEDLVTLVKSTRG